MEIPPSLREEILIKVCFQNVLIMCTPKEHIVLCPNCSKIFDSLCVLI